MIFRQRQDRQLGYAKSTVAKRLKTRLAAVGQVLFYHPFRDHHSVNVWDLNGVFVAKCYGRSCTICELVMNAVKSSICEKVTSVLGALTDCTRVPRPWVHQWHLASVKRYLVRPGINLRSVLKRTFSVYKSEYEAAYLYPTHKSDKNI